MKSISTILKAVTPTNTTQASKENISKIAFDLVEEEVKKFPEVIGIEFGGSFAKGTWLSKDADIDIFVRFKKSTSEEKFEKISRKVGFDALKKYSPYVRYSEHPYVEAKIKDTKINIVPFYDITDGKWKSAADRSPHHTKFMKKSLTPEMKNDVRVLKQFLKSQEIYGAEIAKQGFSGYVSEVLILNYGSFQNTIKAISKINEGDVIGKTSKRFSTPIVIIDPIDKNRNLAAAISDNNVGKFILACRAFAKKPSSEFFKHKRLLVTNKYWNNLVTVKFDFKQRSPDIIWGQIKRTTNSLATQLELAGFEVLRTKSYTDQKEEAALFFLLKSSEIPSTYTKSGPEFFREDSSSSFIAKNQKSSEMMWIGDDKKIVSLEKRKYTKAEKFLAKFLKENLHTGISKGLQSDFKKGFNVMIGNKRMSKSIKEAAGELVSTDGTILHFS